MAPGDGQLNLLLLVEGTWRHGTCVSTRAEPCPTALEIRSDPRSCSAGRAAPMPAGCHRIGRHAAAGAAGAAAAAVLSGACRAEEVCECPSGDADSAHGMRCGGRRHPHLGCAARTNVSETESHAPSTCPCSSPRPCKRPLTLRSNSSVCLACTPASAARSGPCV